MQHQTASTKRRWLVAISGLAVALGISTIAAPSILRAQGSPAASLRGTWLVSVKRSNGTPFQNLVTYLEGGDLLVESNDASARSGAHGAWTKTGDRQFTVDVVFFRFDSPATHKYIGTTRVTATIQVDASGTTFQAMPMSQNFDPDGNPEGPPLMSVNTGKRLYATGTALAAQSP